MPGRRPRFLPLAVAVVVAVAAVAAVAGAVEQAACPSRPPAARYSSKTAYQLVHDGGVAPQDTVQGCDAAYLWHVLRHGTRYPSAKEIAKLTAGVAGLQARIHANLLAGRVTLCRGDAERLLSWTLNATLAQGNDLQAQGQRDLLGIARRFKARYPAFFGRHARDAFTFRSTDARRTLASATWYGRGLFDEDVAAVVDNGLLKFYENCPAWEAAVDANASARAEVTKFQDGAVVKAAVGRVSERLGFEQALDYDDVELLWEACRYDQAWDPDEEAPWCTAFDQEDLLVFEYRADIKYYYVGGYGNAMDLQLGCPLVKDLVDKLSAFEAGDTGRRGNAYFTHSTAMHLTMARLGIGRDALPLTADSYEAMKTARKWSISGLGPFAANIAVVLYECPSGEKHKLRMYVNERPVAVEGCSAPDALCSWSDFKQRFAAVASACTLDFCERSAAASARWATTARVLATAVVAAPLLSITIR